MDTFEYLDVLPLTGTNEEEDRGGLVGPTKLEHEGTTHPLIVSMERRR